MRLVKKHIINLGLWFGFFVLGKLAFILLNNPHLGFGEILLLLWKGWPLDFAIISAVHLILFFVLTYYAIAKITRANPYLALHRVQSVCVLLCAMVISLDIRLFSYWGYKINRTPFEYLSHPSLAFASISVFDVMSFFIIILGLSVPFIIASKDLWEDKIESSKKTKLIYIVLIPVCFIGIRGGLGPASLNQSVVYHSNNMFINQAATNPVWNLISSYMLPVFQIQNYQFFEEEAYERKLSELDKNLEAVPIAIDPSKCKNLVFIILESFSANAIGSIREGLPYTPAFDSLAQEGILFTNHYASGDRSAESLTTIFTGFPAFTVIDILDDPQRLDKLPNLFASFNDKGFQTSFVHGGDLRFANMASLLNAGGVKEIITEDDFSTSDKSNKWGVHDEVSFDKFFQLIQISEQPFMASLFSLSSHEPFNVPFKGKFVRKPNKFFNAINYTDSCLGDLCMKLKRLPSWNNTLFIITADHGSRQPNNYILYDAEKFHTPLLLWGGPVLESQRVTHSVGQTSIAPFVNELFHLNMTFPFAFASLDTKGQDVFYCYNEGAGWIGENKNCVYDVSTGKQFGPNDSNVWLPKLHLQRVAQFMGEY
jgi:phosphoglycerol transferase MdoB-like AlkP superfamily enzyme